jgi:hypothetical protein
VSPLSSQAPPPAAAAVDSPSLAPNRDKSGVLNLKIAELEVQNKKLHQELQELKARGGGGGGGGGDSSTESLLRSRVKQLEDQLDLMELALPIKSDEPTKASFDTVTAVYFKSLSKLDESTLQTLLPQNKHVSSLVVDALERQRANDGEVVGLAAVALVQAIAAAVGKLDERGGGAAATDATKKSVMTNRLTSSGLVSLMSQLAHLAADSASCTVAVHRAARAVFVAMLAAGLMVRAADGGLAPVPSAPDADESRRKRLERNLSSMRFTTEAKPLPPAPGKEAPLSPSLSSRTQYQSMPGRPGVANPDPAPPQKQAPTKASAAAVPTLDIPRGRANGPTRTRGRRASSVEAPRFQQAAEKKAAVESRTLSPGRRVMGVAAPKQKKQSEKTSEPMRRDLRNMGGVPTVDMEGALLLRSTAAADASGRLFADASKAIDTSFSLVNVLLLSDGHLEYRKMPTGSAQEAKEAAASLRGQSLSAVCARLLKDCVKLSEVVTSDVAAARDTAKNMIFKVRELKRVVTDVSAFAPRFGAPEDFATRCEAAMTALSTSVANLVKLAKEELLDDTVKLDIDNRAKVSRQAVAAAMRGLLDVLPAQCRAIVTSPESSSADGAAPLEAGVVLKVSGERFEVVIDSTSQCLFRLRDKTSASGGLQFKSRDDDVMMEWVNAIEAHGVNTVL